MAAVEGKVDEGKVDEGAAAAEDGVAKIPSSPQTEDKPFVLPDGVEFSQIVPDTYKDKPYMKDISDVDGLFKKFDGAESLVGKKTVGIPGEGSTDEERTEFYRSLGVPEKADEYEFKAVVINGKEVERNTEFDGKVKGMLHKHNLTKEQALGVSADFEALAMEQNSEQIELIKQMDKDFETKSAKYFGDKKDAILAETQEIVSKYAPEGFKEQLSKLDNDSLLIMSGVLHNYKTKHVSEDTINGGGGEGAGDVSIADLRAEGKRLYASEAYQNTRHANHQQVKEEYNQVYAKIRDITNKK